MNDDADLDEIDKQAQDRARLAKKWRAEITAAKKAQAKWEKRAKAIEKIYADDRDLSTERQRRFNILWSNVETLRPAVYMQTPKAQAVRRYRDRDPVARFSSMLIERSVQTCCELYDFDHAMDQAVRDRLTVGRGQAWLFLDAPIVGEGEQADVAYWSATADYLPWPDFLHAPCATWSDMPWVARRFEKSRRELMTWLKERGLDEAQAATVTMDCGSDGENREETTKDERSRAEIWEVWDKTSGTVIYVAPGSNENAILGQVPPPVQYRDFFPCPRPMLATTTARSLIPTPDYALYQDQAEELNRVTARIGLLQKALKVAGVYDSSAKQIERLLTSDDNTMIPVEDWAMFKEGGGASGKIEWFPVQIVADTLLNLYQVREQAKATLYEVSGIGDILRGATDPDETATAQGIKAKWGSLRVRRMQKDAQRFAADIMRMKAEIICEVFPFDVMLRMAGMDDPDTLSRYAPPDPVQRMQFMAEVERLLKDDVARNFRIDVETDSTLEPDEMEEKQARMEFTQAFGQMMKEAAPAVEAGPEVAKVVGEVMLFAVRGFKKASQLEQAIEQMAEALAKPKPPKPDPAMVKVEADIKRDERKTDAEIAATQRKTDAEIQTRVFESQADLAIKREASQQQMDINAANAAAKQAMVEGAPPQ